MRKLVPEYKPVVKLLVVKDELAGTGNSVVGG